MHAEWTACLPFACPRTDPFVFADLKSIARSRPSDRSATIAIVDAPSAEFDSVAENYEALHSENVRASGYSTSHFAEYKIKEIAAYLAEQGKVDQPLAVLNFGCGIGNTEEFLRRHLPAATIYGADVSQKSIDYARARHRDLPQVHFSFYDGRTLPWNFPFDVIFIANVLHHVPRAEHVPMLKLLRSSLAPAGDLFLFEHNPWNPITVRAVKTCGFDQGAVLLSPSYAQEIFMEAAFRRCTRRFTLFFPKALAILTPLEKYLRKVPLGAQYYVIAGQ